MLDARMIECHDFLSMAEESPQPLKPMDDYARGLLAIYQVERGDQQTSGNQSRALVGTGLAYAGAAAALLNQGSTGGGEIDPLLIMAAPLPLVALISLLILGIGNIQQRAKYLVALEIQLEPYLSAVIENDHRYALTVPYGFRRSEYVFAPPGGSQVPEPIEGASRRTRGIGSILMGSLTNGAMLLAEIGLIYYALSLLEGWHLVTAVTFYGCCIAAQGLGWYVALRPGSWEQPG